MIPATITPWIYNGLRLAVVTLGVKWFILDQYQFVKYHVKFWFVILSVSLTGLVHIPIFLSNPRSVKNTLYLTPFARLIAKIVGLSWDLRNGEILAEDRGAVIVANHQNSVDILGLVGILPTIRKCAPVAKKQLLYTGPFGLAAWLCGIVFIERENPKTAYQHIANTAALMHTEKIKLWMYPEGTRNMSGDTFLPFRKGAFRIAISCQVPIIPVVFSPYYFVDDKKKTFGSGTVVITALPAIPTTGLTMEDLDDLMATTRSIMLKSYNAVTEEVTESHKNK